MKTPRILRVAELIQGEPEAVRNGLSDVSRAFGVTVSEVPAGVLLTFELRRSWWDRRPRNLVLNRMLAALGAVVQATSRVVVVGAVIERNGKILAAQRAHPAELAGKWEFPGGKVELGETPATALVRECAEELGVAVRAGAELGRVGLASGAVLVVMWAHLVDPLAEPQALEHRDLAWCTPASLSDLDWLATNIRFVDQVSHTAV
ncbi:MAG: ADP-ribose pyrophosphatase [Pseudonocardiales bacterium]|nr:ADP-ribose pyrophosphatase [Pseudonocardiales bacterium]